MFLRRLVRRYVPGIPHVAMIKELRAVGAIEELPDGRLRALKRNYIPRELTDNQIRLWGSILEDVGTALEHNLMRERTEAPRFERRALSLTIERKSLEEFEAFLAEKVRHSSSVWMIGSRRIRRTLRPPDAVRRCAWCWRVSDSE